MARKKETVTTITERALRSGAATMTRMQNLVDQIIQRYEAKPNNSAAEDAAMIEAFGKFMKDAGAGMAALASGLAKMNTTPDKKSDEDKPVSEEDLLAALKGTRK